MVDSSADRSSPGGSLDARRRVSVKTLGCKVNQVEGEQILAELLDSGFDLSEESSADVVVVNTCTVTGEADAKARKAIRHALNANPNTRVVVTGCLAALEAEAIAALGERVLVASDPTGVPALVTSLGASSRRGSGGVVSTRTRSGVGFHTRAMVKIEDGCDSLCTYCVVPYARGNPRSVPADEVLAQCRALVEAGVNEIVLTGINLGRYDDSGLGLPSLVERAAATGVARLRLSSIEPLDVTDELLGTLSAIRAFCEHLHVPLQSGDDDVLREMGRAYTSVEYAERIAAARRAIPGLAVSTDVLVGFPGETGAQAENTVRFCRALGFDRLHVFRYSARQRTSAAERNDQVPPDVRSVRARSVRELDRELRASSARAARGSEREMLVERIRNHEDGGTAVAEGTTREYERVRLPFAQTSACVGVGSLIEVILGGRLEDGTLSASLAKGTNQEVAGQAR